MRNQKGFTLLELALAMLVVGIIVALLASGLQSYLEKTRIDTTKQRMDTVETAIKEFLDVNFRYPCPARVDVAPGGGNFGVETSNPADAPEVDCRGDSNLGGGGTFSTGTGGAAVRHGSVPVRTLNLSDEYMVDGWGNRFTYAVTTRQASDDTTAEGTRYQPNGGTVEMQDSAANVFANNAHYVLLSHGETGNGSFKLFSTSRTPPIACPATGLDRENCDYNDRRFTVTLRNSENAASFFDDLVRYQGQQKADNVPQNAVMAFNLPACPPGWSTFTQAEGRFVVGMNDGAGTAPPANFSRFQYIDDGTAADISASGANDAFNTGLLGQNGTSPEPTGLPPYLALLYCQKD